MTENALGFQVVDIQCVLYSSSVEEVGAVFGERILEYTISLCQGKFDYLERLPDDILLRILSYLELKNTTLLAQASQRFRKVSSVLSILGDTEMVLVSILFSLSGMYSCAHVYLYTDNHTCKSALCFVVLGSDWTLPALQF